MKIPINIPLVGKEEIRAVTSVLREGSLTSSSFVGGKNVQEFEKLSRSFVGSKFAIAVNSGTAALQAALYALDVKKDDEVLLPSFTFVATANAVVSVGAKPIFVDTVRANYTMDPQDLKKKITKKSKVIIPVHLYGNIAYIDEILEIANSHGLKVLEDAAQSLGSTYKGKQSGTFSDIGCYSLYPAKVMTSGEGGFVVTDDKKLDEKLRMIRNHGMVHGYDTKIFGLNLRMPEISAAIARIQIKKLPKFLLQRRKNAEILTSHLSNSDVILPKERKFEKVNWYLYTIAIKKRDSVMKKLNSNGVGAAAYYSTPIHKTPYFHIKSKLADTDWAASHVLSLPIHPAISKKELSFVSKTLKMALQK